MLYKPTQGIISAGGFRNHPRYRGCIGHWMFAEGGGLQAFDVSGFNNDGTLTSGPTWVGGQFGSALNFDGINDYVDAGNKSILQLATGTVLAWIKTSNAGTGYRGIAVKQYAYGMFLVDNIFGIYDWGGATQRSSGVNLADGIWHQVGLSFRDTVTSGTALFIDGVSALTTEITILNQTVAFVMGDGGVAANQNFTDLIDEVRIYNRALTAAEVASLYNDPFLEFRPMRKRVFASVAAPPLAARFRRSLSALGTRIGARQLHAA